MWVKSDSLKGSDIIADIQVHAFIKKSYKEG